MSVVFNMKSVICKSTRLGEIKHKPIVNVLNAGFPYIQITINIAMRDYTLSKTINIFLVYIFSNALIYIKSQARLNTC